MARARLTGRRLEKDGLGLNITAEASDRLTFEGGGGYVTAAFSRDHQEILAAAAPVVQPPPATYH